MKTERKTYTAKTPEFRVSFPAVFKPQLNRLNGKMEFKVQMIFDKSTDLSKLKAIAAECAKDKWPDGLPTDMRNPFKDGNAYNETSDNPREELKDCIFVNAKNQNKPGIVDGNLEPLLDESEFYGGCYARASVNISAYDKAGNRGISIWLNNLQKLRDGTPFSGKVRAEDDFAPITPEDVANQPETPTDIFA